MGKTGTIAEAFLQGREFLFQPEICRNDLETAVEWYRVLANWGRSPQTPSEGVPPPASPLLKPLYWCTFKPTGAMHSMTGANTRAPT